MTKDDGKRGKDDGMGRADENANEAWKQAADIAVMRPPGKSRS